MNWLTTLAFAVLLLSVQYDAVESVSPTLTRSPWANPARASSIMNCLIAKLAGSNVLPQQEKEDLESIMDTMMSAINGASAKGKSSGAQLQAINMAVASSLAELVVAEDAGNQASIAVKTQALSRALEQCFQAVMGTVDRKFITEINDLITMFAKEAATEANEIPDEGPSYATGSSSSSSFEASSQSSQTSSQTAGAISTYPGGAYPGPQVSQLQPIGIGPQISPPAPIGYTGGAVPYGSGAQFGIGGAFGPITSPQADLISRMSNALSNTSTMRTVLTNTITRRTVTTVIHRTIQTLARTLGLDGNNLSSIALQAISQIPEGSETSAYTQALSTALIKGGVLNESNIDTLGSQVLSAVLSGVSNAAQGLGINVDTGSVQNDISSSTSSLSKSSSSTSFSQKTSASTTSGFPGAYPAPLISQPGPIGVGPQVSQPAGAGPLGGFGALPGQAGFGQAGGANAALISKLATSLANSSTLRTLLSSSVSQQTASNLVQRAIQTSSGTLGVDGNSLARIALQAISQLPAGADTSAYAQAVSSALFSAGVLNASNFDTSVSNVLSAILNGFSSAAQIYGISLPTGSVQTDISSSSLSTSSSSTSFSSQTSAAASTSGFPGAYPAPLISQPGPIGVGPQVSQPAGAGPLGGFGILPGPAGSPGVYPGPQLTRRAPITLVSPPSLVPSGAGQPGGVSISSTINSPNGLRSGSAAARISQLTSSIGSAITPYGVDANAFASSLQASFSNILSSGMSSSDAKIEVLLEIIVGLLQLLSNTQIRGVNMATASSVASSAASSFELALA